MDKCNLRNTDYVTKHKKYFIKKLDNEIHIWTKPNKCVVIKQLLLPFKLT